MSLIVQNGGGLVTVQDRGRFGYQRFGFSTGGALDRDALAAANALVGNALGEAVLEILLAPPSLTAEELTFCAVTGGGFAPRVNGAPVPLYRAFCLHPGDKLTFAPAPGACACLAVAGGFDLPLVMGSRSTNLKCAVGGYEGRKLRAGDALPLRDPPAFLLGLTARVLPAPEPPGKQLTLRCVPGPQDDLFTARGKARFFHEYYTVTADFDRMGCRFDGGAVETVRGSDIVSDGIAPGAVQIPPSGKPIVMLADRQTTGGYAKIATVVSCDLPRLAQCAPGTRVRFQPVSIEEAQAAARTARRKEAALASAFETILY